MSEKRALCLATGGEWGGVYTYCQNSIPLNRESVLPVSDSFVRHFFWTSGCNFHRQSDTGWGDTIPDDGSTKCHYGGSDYDSGVEVRSLRTLTFSLNSLVNGVCDTNSFTTTSKIIALRLRSANCPDGYLRDAGACVPTGVDPYKNNQQCPSNGSNPIHGALGYKLQTENDYLPSAFSTSSKLSFNRYYSSGEHWELTELGYRWRHEYDRKIDAYPDTTIPTVVVYRGNGDRNYFILDNNQWITDEDINAKLVELQDVDLTTIGWQYIDQNDVVETYDAIGKLLSIESRNGDRLDFSYDITVANGGDSNSKTLDKVTDNKGRYIALSYDALARITVMTDPNSNTYAYSYDELGNLASVTYPDTTDSDDSDNQTRRYLYEDTNFPHALTGITDENGVRYATWSYDEEGRAISSEHANGVDKTTLTYNADGTTTVTNPLGKQTTYHFTTIHGVKKVTQVEGHPTASCEGANKSYSYDANGNIASKTDWNGITTNYTYDMDRNLELTRIEAVGTPQERTITTEWHADFRLPTKITEPGKVTEYTYDAKGRQLSSKVSSVQ